MRYDLRLRVRLLECGNPIGSGGEGSGVQLGAVSSRPGASMLILRLPVNIFVKSRFRLGDSVSMLSLTEPHKRHLKIK